MSPHVSTPRVLCWVTIAFLSNPQEIPPGSGLSLMKGSVTLSAFPMIYIYHKQCHPGLTCRRSNTFVSQATHYPFLLSPPYHRLVPALLILRICLWTFSRWVLSFFSWGNVPSTTCNFIKENINICLIFKEFFHAETSERKRQKSVTPLVHLQVYRDTNQTQETGFLSLLTGYM